MKISKNDALIWFDYFSHMPEDEELSVKHEEIIYATFAQIEAAVDHRNDALLAEIKNVKSLENRTVFVGNESNSFTLLNRSYNSFNTRLDVIAIHNQPEPCHAKEN